MIEGLLVHDVTIVTPATTVDRYNNTTKHWAGASRVDTKGWIAQQSRSEVLGDREAEVSDWILYLLPGDTITAQDRVEWYGITFEVDGQPNRAWTPRGEHHTEISLRVVEG